MKALFISFSAIKVLMKLGGAFQARVKLAPPHLVAVGEPPKTHDDVPVLLDVVAEVGISKQNLKGIRSHSGFNG